MFKHILVPLDGSQLAESVLPAVAYLARTFSASVTLFHVVEEDAPVAVHGEIHLHDAGRATEYLTDIAKNKFTRRIKVDFHVHTAKVKDVAKSIVAHKREFKHDLVVMCTHGRGRALHLLLGSIAQQVINKGDIPVLILHPHHDTPAIDFSCRSILLPLDEMAEHKGTLPLASEIAQKCRSKIHLIMVIQTYGTVFGRWTSITRYLPGTTAQMLELSAENAEEYLEKQLAKLVQNGVAGSADVLRGDPANVIVDAAQKLSVDVIVLGTHGRTGIDALFSGSVANKVCSRCQIPVLLIPV